MIRYVIRVLLSCLEYYSIKRNELLINGSYEDYSNAFEKEIICECLISLIGGSNKVGFQKLKEGLFETKKLKIDNENIIKEKNNNIKYFIDILNDFTSALNTYSNLFTTMQLCCLNSYILTFIDQLKEGASNE